MRIMAIRETLEKIVQLACQHSDAECACSEIVNLAKAALEAPPEPVGNSTKMREALKKLYD